MKLLDIKKLNVEDVFIVLSDYEYGKEMAPFLVSEVNDHVEDFQTQLISIFNTEDDVEKWLERMATSSITRLQNIRSTLNMYKLSAGKIYKILNLMGIKEFKLEKTTLLDIKDFIENSK